MVSLNLKPAKIHGMRYIGGYGFSTLSKALEDQGATSGGEVFVPIMTLAMPGTSVTVPKYTKLVGASWEKSLLQWTDATANDGLRLMDEAGSPTNISVTLRDLKLEATQGKTGNAIYSGMGTHVDIDHLWIEDWGGDGIKVVGSDPDSNAAFYSQIQKCRINYVKNGIEMSEDVRTWLLSMNRMDYMYGGTYPSTGGSGIKVTSGYAIKCLLNCIEHANSGIQLLGCPVPSIDTCYAESVAYAFNLTNSTAAGTINNCYGFGIAYEFLQISTGRYATVYNNQCASASSATLACYLGGDVTGLRAWNNYVTNDGGTENRPWTFNSITGEPDCVEATIGGPDSLYPAIVRGSGAGKMLTVSQGAQPTLTYNGQTLIWHDTDDGKIYLMSRANSTTKKVELI